ncbi:hypothetical protein FRB99_005195 [Tulasnella sp. 403]|nr:hypothetical protein FRB99_005195 [Tulasnella sp. 403]
MSLTYPLLPSSSRPRSGILLNAIRHPQSQSQSPTTPSSPSSSSADVSASEDSAKDKSPARRITFAPLPNPRADNVPNIVLDHVDSPLPYDNPELASSFSGDDNPAAPPPASPVINAKRSSWTHSTKKLLKPFYKPLRKAAALDSDSGGALGLFRASSIESTSSVGTFTDSGAPLSRRMSTGSYPNDPSDKSYLALTPVVSENGGVSAGTRLLNGRVYGRSRLRPVSQVEEVEPEFVEWGYGGMGSNQGNTSSLYAKVQSSHKNVVAEDDDDGSGMGWVRKRRETREREKREREEREAKEAQLRQAEPSPADDQAAPPPTTPTLPPSSEHITHAVTLPARSPSLQSRPPQSRQSSESRHSGGTITPNLQPSGRTTPLVTRPSNESTYAVVSVHSASSASASSTLRNQAGNQSSDSADDNESDEGTEREEDSREDDDDDDDEEEEASRRMTSVCAGVEKISRHKD